MKQLLLATAALVGLSSAALAAEPMALTDSQLDNVTAGQTFASISFPAGASSLGVAAALGAVVVGPTSAAANPLAQALAIPIITPGM